MYRDVKQHEEEGGVRCERQLRGQSRGLELEHVGHAKSNVPSGRRIKAES